MISRIVDPATATPINFGDPVLQGASEQPVLSVNGDSGAFRGIAVRDPTLPPAPATSLSRPHGCACMTKGVIWVTAAGR